MNTRIIIAFFLFLFSCKEITPDIIDNKPVTETDTPTLTNISYADLKIISEDLKNDKSEVVAAYNNLINAANNILTLKAEKVTDGVLPPSSNNHDFYAIGKYSWPDTIPGRTYPWIRIDGKVNPASNSTEYDLNRLNSTVDRVNKLALAWFYSKDERYAIKAKEILRIWFLDTETKMNPNFNFASAQPGKFDGMAIGIIFGAQFVNLIDHINLLTLSKNWTKTDNDEMKQWFAEYSNWLLTSEFGIEEGEATNNHGSWYTAQVAASAIYSGNNELAHLMVEKGRKQIADQIAKSREGFPDGSLPRELSRNQSFSYSIYGLRALCSIAGCADAINEDLWNYQAENGVNLKIAFSFITPYLIKPDLWSWESLSDTESITLDALSIVRQGAKKYKTSNLFYASEYLTNKSLSNSEKIWLLGKNSY